MPAVVLKGVLGLIAAIVALNWRLLSPTSHSRIWDPDLVNQVLPWLDYQAREWAAGRWAWWDPSLWMGQSLPGQVQPGFAYPLNWALFSLGLEAGHIPDGALSAYFLSVQLIAGLACYVMLRGFRASAISASAASAVWAVGGYMGGISWPQWLHGACWTPLIFHFMARGVRSRPWRNGAIAGVAAGLAWLSGHHQAPLLTTVAALAWIVASLTRPAHRGAAFQTGASFLIVSTLIGSPQILPALESGRSAVRWVGEPDPIPWTATVPYRAHERLALPASSLIGFLLPSPQKNVDPFVGAAATGLFFAGIAVAFKRRMTFPHRFFAILGIASLAFALGPATPLHGLLYSSVPGLHRARWPSGVLYLTSLSMAVFIGYGIDSVLRRNGHALRRALGTAWLAGAAILGATTVTLTLLGHAVESRLGLTIVACLVCGAIVLGAVRAQRLPTATIALISAMALVEISGNSELVSAPAWDPGRNQWSRALRANGDIAAYLKSQPGPFRVEMPGTIVPNWGSWHGLEMWRGYLPAIDHRLYAIPWDDPEVRARWGLRYTIAPEPTSGAQREVFRGASGLRVFENPGAFPRAWIEPAPGCEAEPARVHWLKRTPGRLELRVSAECDGDLIVSETYDPGWHATIDGASASVSVRHVAMRSVRVPRGEHSIEFVYRPRSVWVGMLLSGLGLIVTAALLVSGRQS